MKGIHLTFALLLFAGTVLVLTWPAPSGATLPNNQPNTYVFFMEEPNVAQDTFTSAGGQSFGGSWTLNGLVAFQPYGCGIVGGTPIPPELCGGRLTLDITAATPFGPRPALLTIFCVIGGPPASIEEGINAAIPGVGDFNRQTAGMNVYVLQP